MFWNKTKVAALAVLATSLVATGSIIGIYRARGATQSAPKDQAQSTAAKNDHPVNPVPVLTPENPPPLSPRTQADLPLPASFATRSSGCIRWVKPTWKASCSG